MEHLKYFEKEEEVTNNLISERPMVYYVEETDEIFYFDEGENIINDIGSISETDNSILINEDSLETGTYTISYADANGKELESWMDITKITI